MGRSSADIKGIFLTGGYYRLNYKSDPADSARHPIADEDVFVQQVQVPKSGSMIARTGSGGREVDLEFDLLGRDIDDNIRYIAWAETSRELQRTFTGRNNPLVQEIYKSYGKNFYDNLVKTLKVITNPPRLDHTAWGTALKIGRTNAYWAMLMGSLGNIAIQITQLPVVAKELGPLNFVNGVGRFYASPFAHISEINEKSTMMRNRFKTISREQREATESMTTAHPYMNVIKAHGMTPQILVDSLIAYPGWLGAYRRYISENNKADATEAQIKKLEKDAINFADEMVVGSIGGGLIKDAGRALNETALGKLLTLFYTFAHRMYNLQVKDWGLLRTGQIGMVNYLYRKMMDLVMPALLYAMIRGEHDDEDDPYWHVKSVASYNLGMIIFLREIGAMVDGYQPSNPIASMQKNIWRASKELVDAGIEQRPPEFPKMIRAISSVVPVPGAYQIAKAVEAADPEKRGDQHMIEALIRGPER